ncbi:MAG: uracil phosphoribosyltransferase [Phycisphaeraceae bacterium]|nr:uracil phosphoribosyltransferase [Phycisphaeraceae bacterium]
MTVTDDTPWLRVSRHPVIAAMLTEVRDERTASARFRQLLAGIGLLLAYEATTDLPAETVGVRTPMEGCQGVTLPSCLTIVPILRAGLGLAEGCQQLLPQARVGHLGMFRDEKALTPVSYYEKLPKHLDQGRVLLVDPMLATGGSAAAAVSRLRERGAKDIRLLCLIAAPEGLECVHRSDGGVIIHAAAVDRQLNDKGYILPGLGDAGDRLFGTLE